MIETDTDIDAMHITTNPEFQPYLMQALATFQADNVSKDKGKQCMKLNGVHIPSHKKPENCTTTIAEELFSPEIQKSIKKAAPNHYGYQYHHHHKDQYKLHLSLVHQDQAL